MLPEVNLNNIRDALRLTDFFSTDDTGHKTRCGVNASLFVYHNSAFLLIKFQFRVVIGTSETGWQRWTFTRFLDYWPLVSLCRYNWYIEISLFKYSAWQTMVDFIKIFAFAPYMIYIVLTVNVACFSDCIWDVAITLLNFQVLSIGNV